MSLLDRPEMRLLARVFVLWAGGTWRPNEVEEWVWPEDLVDEIVSVAGRSREEAAGAVLRIQEMGRELAARGVADLVRTYMEVLSVLGLPCGSGADRARQERALGSMSALLVDFEHSMKRAGPPPTAPGLEWLNGTGLDAEAEVAEERAVAEAHEAGTAGTEEVVAREAPAPGGAEGGLPERGPGWGLASFGGKLVPGEVFLARLKVFLERFASQAVEETAEGVEPDAGAVNIMTVHQAKGLEFPVVFVPCLVDGRFPSSRTGERKRWYIPDDPAAAGLFDRDRYEGRLADERRLFYVALTRAKELLVLSCFAEHRGRKACPSQFLRELLSGETMKGEFRRMGEVRPLAVASARSQEDGLVVDCGQLLVYSECPRKYYLRYVCGFAPPIAPALGFGKVAHHVVCEMARRARLNALPSPSDAAAILQERFYLPFASRAQRQAMLDALKRRLGNYVGRHAADLARTLDVECRFEVPLEGARLRGRIDLVLRGVLRCDAGEAGEDPAAVEIVDIKTAENRPPLPQHQNQLRLYAQAARTLGMNPVRLAIHDLDSEDGAAIPVEDDPRELERFQEDMCRWVHGIRAGRFSPVSRMACNECDYEHLC